MMNEGQKPFLMTWTNTWERLLPLARTMVEGMLEGAWVLETPASPTEKPSLFWARTGLEAAKALVPGAFGHVFNGNAEVRWRRLGRGQFRLTWLSEKQLPDKVQDGSRGATADWDWVTAGRDEKDRAGLFLYGAYLPHLLQFLEVGAPGALGGMEELRPDILPGKAPVQGSARRLRFVLYRQRGMVRQLRLTGLELCVPLLSGAAGEHS